MQHPKCNLFATPRKWIKKTDRRFSPNICHKGYQEANVIIQSERVGKNRGGMAVA